MNSPPVWMSGFDLRSSWRTRDVIKIKGLCNSSRFRFLGKNRHLAVAAEAGRSRLVRLTSFLTQFSLFIVMNDRTYDTGEDGKHFGY